MCNGKPRTNMTNQKLLMWAYYALVSITLIMANTDDSTLKTCYPQTLLDCPANSLCSRLNATSANATDILKCICLQDYQLNPQWQEFENPNQVEEIYCIALKTDEEEEEQHKIIVYMRSAANPHHLIFGIILVLLMVTLVTAALYTLKVMHPIRRTKAVYKRLKNRRQNITPLQEMDELEMNRRFEMQTY